MNDSSHFTQVETDAEKAKRYREELREPLSSVLDIMNRAAKDGLNISFTVQRDQFGRLFIPEIPVTRPL